MRPQNKVYQYWCLMVLVLDCTYTAFIVPIGVGFSISDVTFTWAAVCDFVAGEPRCFRSWHVVFFMVGGGWGSVFVEVAKITQNSCSGRRIHREPPCPGHNISAQAGAAVHVPRSCKLCCMLLQGVASLLATLAQHPRCPLVSSCVKHVLP